MHENVKVTQDSHSSIESGIIQTNGLADCFEVLVINKKRRKGYLIHASHDDQSFAGFINSIKISEKNGILNIYTYGCAKTNKENDSADDLLDNKNEINLEIVDKRKRIGDHLKQIFPNAILEIKWCKDDHVGTLGYNFIDDELIREEDSDHMDDFY